MSLILKTNSSVTNYQFDKESGCFSSNDGTRLFKLMHYAKDYEIVDDHTFKFVSNTCFLTVKLEHDYCITIDEPSSLTIDENTLKNSAFIYSIKYGNVTMFNSTIIAEGVAKCNYNIVNSFAYLYHEDDDFPTDSPDSYEEECEEESVDTIDIIDCNIFSNIKYSVPKLTVRPNETLIVLITNKDIKVNYQESTKIITLNNVHSLDDDGMNMFDINITNVNRYSIENGYMMFVGNRNMSIYKTHVTYAGHYATDKQLEEINKKYHPSNLHCDAYAINVEYCNEILTGIKYIQDHPNEPSYRTKSKYELMSIEKGAKLFIEEYMLSTHYHINVKENSIVSLYDNKYIKFFDSEYGSAPWLLPNFFMKLIINHSCGKRECVSSGLLNVLTKINRGALMRIIDKCLENH